MATASSNSSTAESAGSAGPDSTSEHELGILERRLLPTDDYLALWDAIVINPEIKERLLAHALLNFTVRLKVDRSRLPLHGLILMVGPPGTGKTSLARGLAAMTAARLPQMGQFQFLEIDPHDVASAGMGQRQKAVTDLLGKTVARYARVRPTIVLLDEVETLAVARSGLSMDVNPIDVHRATDALLAQLDLLASNTPNLLFVATSNFPKAIDEAFISRSDYLAVIDRPSADACQTIFYDTVNALAEHFPSVRALLGRPEMKEAAYICRDLDGRQIRKFVLAACALRTDTALDPNTLEPKDLLKALQRGKEEHRKLAEAEDDEDDD
ncbi:MAG: AAA family ATPase [Gemmataceae bacterium]